MYKLDFEKAEEPGTELPTLILFWRKQESYRGKKIASMTILKHLTVDHYKLENS